MSSRNGPTPRGIVNQAGRGYQIDSIDFRGGFVEGRPYKNTFQVEPKHETLPNALGVRFNVETVPAASDEDLNKERLGKSGMLSAMKGDALTFYAKPLLPMQMMRNESPRLSKEDIIIEAISNAPDTTVFAGGSGFFAACLTAFAHHLPLSLSPDHVWTCISYAFAKHVDQHAEDLRHNFVQHEGKKRLEFRADHMVMGGRSKISINWLLLSIKNLLLPGDLNKGSAAEVWEATIFPEFSRQIKKHVGEKVHDAISSDFTTTTNTARAAHEITLMSAMKNYFSYGFRTCCGIPNITLLGTQADWEALRARAQDLGNLMTPEVMNCWMPHLLPVLDQFVESYKGNVNHGFWQSMIKFRHTGGGSGAHSFISGWIQILFPYLSNGRFNTRLRPWNEMYFTGPEPGEIPAIISSAPVDWDYYGTTHDLHFHSGFTGFTQDPADGTLSPLIGWYVTHDPPEDPSIRLKKVKDEIEALLKGHKVEAQAVPVDKEQPWYKRVKTLYCEQLSLEGSPIAMMWSFPWMGAAMTEAMIKNVVAKEAVVPDGGYQKNGIDCIVYDSN